MRKRTTAILLLATVLATVRCARAAGASPTGAVGSTPVIQPSNPGDSDSTTVIPVAPSQSVQPEPGPDQTAAPAQTTALPPVSAMPDETAVPLTPYVYSLQDFMNEGGGQNPIGVEVREDCGRLHHEKICGLQVMGVQRNSPAWRAGIRPYHALGRYVLNGAGIAAAMFFPPVIVAVGIIDQTHIGESYDMIIGVDGQRVRHIIDLEDLTANDKPGDTLYLMIVRAGKRIQVPVQLPGMGAATATALAPFTN
ncbi:MAG TPA: PDZ domain-containing protein [Candidatus Binataceae bacterium]|nr:PDZ domain-containing protein [Candidatus Binataceae bacterium]